MSKSITTKKGSVLPLMQLKGKDYMMVAYRLLWLTDDVENYSIDTQFPVLTDEQTVARTTLVIYNQEGKVIRAATGTKRETKENFADHTEKAETGSLGRALAMLGFGTQHAVADIDEGPRIVDAPLEAEETPKTLTKKPNGTTPTASRFFNRN